MSPSGKRVRSLQELAAINGVKVEPVGPAPKAVYRLRWASGSVGPVSYLGALLWLRGFAAGRCADEPDFRAAELGEFTAITPTTDRARGWLQRYVDSDPANWRGGSLLVDPAFAPDIFESMRAAGYSVVASPF